MEKVLYVARHGRATGNEPDADLTVPGREHAKQLAEFFAKRTDRQIDRVISSTYTRAQKTAIVVAEKLHLQLDLEKRLIEREGTETDADITARVVALAEELLNSQGRTFLLVTHRTPLTLLLRHFGFELTEELTNPDVYSVTLAEGSVRVERIWKVPAPLPQ
jgi:2,3-bisphosphoglycerate-dependent phosphoglycerate mutase